MDWIDWLGVGLIGWLVVSVVVGVAFARLTAGAVNATYQALDSGQPVASARYELPPPATGPSWLS
jgi:hypothetical protein